MCHSDQHSFLAEEAVQFFQFGSWTSCKARSDTREAGTLDGKASEMKSTLWGRVLEEIW